MIPPTPDCDYDPRPDQQTLTLLSYGLGGGGGVNCAKSLKPRAISTLAIFFSASSNPSLPNILCSMSSNWSEISSSCLFEKFFFQAGNTIVSSRAAWFAYIRTKLSNTFAKGSAWAAEIFGPFVTANT